MKNDVSSMLSNLTVDKPFKPGDRVIATGDGQRFPGTIVRKVELNVHSIMPNLYVVELDGRGYAVSFHAVDIFWEEEFESKLAKVLA